MTTIRPALRSNPTPALFLSSLGHFTLELCHQFLPVLYPLLVVSMGLSYAQIGMIALVAGVAGSLTQPLFGLLGDRWDMGKQSALSVVWLGVLMGLVGFVDSYWLLLLLVATASFGSAGFHPPGAVIAASASGARKGAGVSIFSVGGNLGSALSVVWMGVAVTWLGVAGTATLIPVALITGGLMYWLLSGQDFSAQQRKKNRLDGVQKAFIGGLVLLMIAVMARSWFQVALITYLPLWIEQNGGTAALGGQLLGLSMFAVGAGSLGGGILSDRIGRWQVLLLAMVLLLPAYWLFMLLPQPWLPLPLLIIGTALGMTFPVALVMAQDALPASAGMAGGLVMGIGWLPGGIGASVTGRLADTFGLAFSLNTLFVPLLVSILCAAGYVLLFKIWERSA